MITDQNVLTRIAKKKVGQFSARKLAVGRITDEELLIDIVRTARPAVKKVAYLRLKSPNGALLAEIGEYFFWEERYRLLDALTQSQLLELVLAIKDKAFVWTIGGHDVTRTWDSRLAHRIGKLTDPVTLAEIAMKSPNSYARSLAMEGLSKGDHNDVLLQQIVENGQYEEEREEAKRLLKAGQLAPSEIS